MHTIQYDWYEDEYGNEPKTTTHNFIQNNPWACCQCCDGNHDRCGLHKSWKTNRKTQYRVKTVKVEKKRKPSDKEYWRGKNGRMAVGYGHRGYMTYNTRAVPCTQAFMSSLVVDGQTHLLRNGTFYRVLEYFNFTEGDPGLLVAPIHYGGVVDRHYEFNVDAKRLLGYRFDQRVYNNYDIKQYFS
jgi:hypothetical protein